MACGVVICNGCKRCDSCCLGRTEVTDECPDVDGPQYRYYFDRKEAKRDLDIWCRVCWTDE